MSAKYTDTTKNLQVFSSQNSDFMLQREQAATEEQQRTFDFPQAACQALSNTRTQLP